MSLPLLTDSQLEIKRRTAILTFEREDVGNTFVGTSLASDALRVLQWLELQEEVSALVITGRGDSFSEEFFVSDDESPRGELVHLETASKERNRHDIRQLIMAMYETDIPVIAAVNGPATGIGLNLACLCDIRIGSDQAMFGSPMSDYAEVTGPAGVWSLLRLVGHQRAMEMALSGRLLEADEALSIGLLLDVVEPAHYLLPTVEQFAGQMTSRSPQHLRRSKRLMNVMGAYPPAGGMDLPSYEMLSKGFC